MGAVGREPNLTYNCCDGCPLTPATSLKIYPLPSTLPPMKHLLLSIGLTASGWVPVLAQSPTAAPVSHRPIPPTPRPVPTPAAQPTDQLLTRLARELQLSQEQLPQVQGASLLRTRALQDLLRKYNRISTFNAPVPDTYAQEAAAIEADFAAHLKRILTSSQYAQYERSQSRPR